MQNSRLVLRPLGCVTAVALIVTIGCNDKSAPSSATTQTPPKMKMTTPIPASITTPDSVDTRIGTLKFNGRLPRRRHRPKGL